VHPFHTGDLVTTCRDWLAIIRPYIRDRKRKGRRKGRGNGRKLKEEMDGIGGMELNRNT